MNVFIVPIPNELNKEEREICEFEMDYKKSLMLTHPLM